MAYRTLENENNDSLDEHDPSLSPFIQHNQTNDEKGKDNHISC